MSRKRRRAIQDLPLTDEVWYVAVRRLKYRIYIQEDDIAFRPVVLIILDQGSGLALNQLVLIEFPDVDEVNQLILNTMRRTDPSLGTKPHRPKLILCERMEWIMGLREAMEPYSIGVSLGQPPEYVDEIYDGLNERMRKDTPQIPGLLSVPEVTLDLVARFFDAAAEFWRSEPWVWLNDRQILAVYLKDDQEPYLVEMMGCGGHEYGFILYRNWDDILKPIMEGLSFPERLPGYGWHSISFDPFDDLPVDDQIAIENFGWTIVDEDFCPFPAIFTHESVQRPPREELILFEEIMRGVPIFTRDFLQPDGHGDYLPVETEIGIVSFDGPKVIKVLYPAGRFTPEEIPYGAGEFDAARAENDVDVQPFDRRRIEGTLAEFIHQINEDDLSPELQEAQDLIYLAWEEDSPAVRVKLAQQALEISPDCVDAYNILAEDAARTVAEGLDYYRKAVDVGEKSLDRSIFEEDVGHFWGVFETRPYMRARLGLAECLREAGEWEEAVHHYRELLRLNIYDNQGVRYLLLDILMDMGQWQAAQELLEKFNDENSATWLFTRALLTFQRDGATKQADRLLKEAWSENLFVPDYLLRIERIPKVLPEMITMGGDSEAVDYAAAHLNYWYRIPGAVGWLGRNWLDSIK